MTTTRVTRALLAGYPPSFRERYGDELNALTEDVGPSTAVAVDLAKGLLVAWLRPALTGTPEGRRRRLQATLATCWIAWCAGALVAPAVNRDLLDPPLRTVTATAQRWLDVGYAAFLVGLAIGGVGALLLAVRVVWPAVRTRDPRVLRPLAPLAVLTAVEGVGAAVLGSIQAGRPAGWHPTGVMLVAVSLWALGFLALVAAGTLAPVVTLSRTRPPAAAMRAPVLLTVPLCAALLVTVGTSVAAELAAGALRPVSAAVLAVGLVAATTAAVSSARGLAAAARSRPAEL